MSFVNKPLKTHKSGTKHWETKFQQHIKNAFCNTIVLAHKLKIFTPASQNTRIIDNTKKLFFADILWIFANIWSTIFFNFFVNINPDIVCSKSCLNF